MSSKGEAPGWSSKTGKIEKPDGAGAAAKPGSSAPRTKAPTPSAIEGATEGPLPGFVEPMLATLAKSPPTGDRWLHEIKFDGYRLQAHIEDGKVTLWTRGGLDWTEKFGDAVPEALRNLPVRTALIDGELVVENESGVSEFSLLQADLSDGRLDRFAYYAFDCLYLDGYDLREAALIRRKELLSQLIGTGGGAIRYSSHFVEDGKLVLQRACALGLEGIVSKASQSVYVSGRGKSWVKSKCSAQQEFVIAGYVPSSTGRKAIGSLVARRLRRRGVALCRTRRDRLFLRRRRGAVRAARRDAHSLESVRQAPHHGRSASSPLRSARAHRARSISAAGPGTACCVRRPFRACAMISRRARLCVRRPWPRTPRPNVRRAA